MLEVLRGMLSGWDAEQDRQCEVMRAAMCKRIPAGQLVNVFDCVQEAVLLVQIDMMFDCDISNTMLGVLICFRFESGLQASVEVSAFEAMP